MTIEQILKRKSIKKPIRVFEKRLLNVFYRPFVQWYTNRETSYSYNDLKVKVTPGVFHPRFFYSTTFMLEFLEFINFNRKKVIEIGSGAGLISIYAATEGANVLAVDICPLAVENTSNNVNLNSSKIQEGKGAINVLQSNLFENVQPGIFDLLLVNPPFYQGEAKKTGEHAWYAGKNLEYFKGLFNNCRRFMDKESEMYLVLSEDCDFQKINTIAREHGIVMKVISEKSFLTESLYIFKCAI